MRARQWELSRNHVRSVIIWLRSTRRQEIFGLYFDNAM
jgi:hypothetical protein